MSTSLQAYGPTPLQFPLKDSEIHRINLYQMVIGDCLFGGILTCRKRHDAPHGWEGDDMGVLIGHQQGLLCPYCGHIQSSAFPTSIIALPDPIYAVISGKDIDYFMSRAHKRLKEYQSLYETMPDSSSLLSLVDSIKARIDELEARRSHHA